MDHICIERGPTCKSGARLHTTMPSGCVLIASSPAAYNCRKIWGSGQRQTLVTPPDITTVLRHCAQPHRLQPTHKRLIGIGPNAIG